MPGDGYPFHPTIRCHISRDHKKGQNQKYDNGSEDETDFPGPANPGNMTACRRTDIRFILTIRCHISRDHKKGQNQKYDNGSEDETDFPGPANQRRSAPDTKS
ncbi:hypothetical protein QUF72_09635 [Desulfobacterales bacterium HSG2]|nr:hypothetical protein [Desulfobacterales bacterium HSG2]